VIEGIKMEKKEMKYYYFLERLEHEYNQSDYADLAREFIENKWLFHGYEMNEETEIYRWQYERRQFVNVVVERLTGKVVEVIL